LQPYRELVYQEPESASLKSFIETLTPKKEANWHYHPEIEITYVLEGEGVRLVGDYVGRFWPGNLMITGSDLPHDFNLIDSQGVSKILVIQFSSKLVTRIPEFSRISSMLEEAKKGISFNSIDRDISDHLYHFLNNPDPEKIIALMHILNFLTEITFPNRTTLSTVNFSMNALDDKSHSRLNKVIAYIDKHKNRRIDLAEIAKYTNMAPPSFCRWFKKSMNISFVNYLNKTRIVEACQLLVNTDKYITEISGLCGFESFSNFNRAFVKHKGVSPKGYRDSYRNKAVV